VVATTDPHRRDYFKPDFFNGIGQFLSLGTRQRRGRLRLGFQNSKFDVMENTEVPAVLGPDTEGFQSIPEPAIRPEGALTTPADLVTYYWWLHKATAAQERSLAPLELDWLRTRYPGVSLGPP
jgi:hypothetical protein